MIQPSKYRSDQVAGSVERLQSVWEGGEFALTVQVPPSATSRPLAQMTTQLRGFDAVLLAEASDGAIALSSVAMAVLFQRAGLAPIVQLSGRDRNRLALQGDILGLGALTIPYVLVDTRPIGRASLGQNADARLVTDLDGPALLATAARLRDEARFISGASIKTPPVFLLGALIDLAALSSVEQLEPAQFLVTAPVADSRHLPDLLSAFQHIHADFLRTRPLLVSIPFARHLPSEQVVASQDAWQSCLSMLHHLQMYEAVRGCNIVLEQLADLEVLEQGASSGMFFSERPK